MFNHQFNISLDFFFFPNTACGVMRVTEDSNFNVVFNDLLFHVFEVHSVCAFGILFQFGQNDFTFCSVNCTCETDVCRAVQQNRIAFVCVCADNVGNAAQNRVLVRDNVVVFDFYAVSSLLPAFDSFIEACASQVEVTHSRRSCQTSLDSCDYGRSCREVHISNPHRDVREAFFNFCARNRDHFPFG